MPHKLRHLTHEALKNAVHVTVGTAGAANSDVQQAVLLMANGDQKMQWLQARLRGFVDEGEVLVFVNKRATVEALAGLVKVRLLASACACMFCSAAERAKWSWALRAVFMLCGLHVRCCCSDLSPCTSS